jgi:hypothetical protein
MSVAEEVARVLGGGFILRYVIVIADACPLSLPTGVAR